jgi:hypothetical protein
MKQEITGSGTVRGPETKPRETSIIEINCSEALKTADIFRFTAIDHHKNELYTWCWPVIHPTEKADEVLNQNLKEGSMITIEETEDAITSLVGNLEISFRKSDGILLSIKNGRKNISLSGGPLLVGLESRVVATQWKKDDQGNFILETRRSGYPEKAVWKLFQNGLLKLETSPIANGVKDIDFVGITFNYPEEKCSSVKWMGRGPYRVWKNRMAGSEFGIWEKTYNNTVTGESFNELIYPEFKGYHGNLYWVTFETTELPFTGIAETPNLYFRLFTPQKPQHDAGGTYPSFPEGDISFLYEIPAIGTKFKDADQLGPKSRKGIYSGHSGDENYPIKLWFDFRQK